MLDWLRDLGSFWGAIFERMDKTHMTLIAAGVVTASITAPSRTISAESQNHRSSTITAPSDP